jgi:hypothetical protein
VLVQAYSLRSSTVASPSGRKGIKEGKEGRKEGYHGKDVMDGRMSRTEGC